MQKCPKCGTILDDSKKQCYMCGTMLKQEDTNSFAEALGLVNDDKEIETFEPLSYANDFSDNEKVNLFYSDDMNKLNSLQYDNRSTFEKNFNPLFNSNDTLISDAKKDSAKQPEHPKKNKTQSSKTPKEPKESKESFTFPNEFNIDTNNVEPNINDQSNQSSSFFGQDGTSDYQETVQMEPKKKKDKYDKNSYKYVTLDEETTEKKRPKIKISFIFNTICVIIFLVILFIAVKTFKTPTDNSNNLGGLRYNIAPEFELVSTDGTNRYYKYDDTCSIKVVYGQTTEGDGFIDNYLSSMKVEFEGQENTETMNEEILLNDNTWKSLSIISFVPKDNQKEYDHFVKYKYVSIFHNGNFYHTIFVNTKNNSECKKMYEDFTNSLIFE